MSTNTLSDTGLTRLTDRKRAAILEAAVAEFRSNGFEVTSMDRIAETAGVSKRTVYNHFPSKEALFAEILTQLWKSSLAGVDLTYRTKVQGGLENFLMLGLRIFID